MLKATSKRSINGTSLQGYIDISYAELVAAFGAPNGRGDAYKVDAEWVLYGEGYTVTLYNYKDGKNYCGASGTAVEAIRDWHIGGNGKRAAELVKRMFPQHNVKVGW